MALNAFTRNAYPSDLHSIVDSCRIRLALVSVNAERLKSEVDISSALFLRELAKNKNNYLMASKKSMHPVVVYSDDLPTQNTLFALLTTSRSFLDIYSKLMGKLISRDVSWSFKRAKVDGVEISGGAIINWLQRSAPKNLTTALSLRGVLLEHSNNWITNLTALRDSIVHHSEIIGAKPLSMPVGKDKNHITRADLILPQMPDGELLSLYGDRILLSTQELIMHTIPLLPNIFANKLSMDTWGK